MNNTSHLLWTGTMAAAWTAAGGVAGGVLIAGIVLAGRVHPEAAFLIAVVLAAVGNVLGGVHGAVLAHLGREPGAARASTAGDAVMFVACIAAAFIGGVLIALWLTLSATVVRAGSLIGWFALISGCVLAAGVITWATLLGWRAFENAYTQWADHRLGGWLVFGAFALISVVFLALRPAVPGTELQLPAPVLLAIAALATVWLAAPAVILALRIAHRQ